MPKVSIITGLYNSERYLPYYFGMLKAQTFQDWEVMLIDDGSKDKTVEISRQVAAQDPRFKLIQKSPEGSPSRSRAVGLAAASGDLVAFVDHDDFWAPQKLELQVALMNRDPNVSICHTDRIIWTSEVKPERLFHYDAPPDAAPVSEQSAKQALFYGSNIVFSAFMAKRSDLVKVGFHPDLRGVDDFYLHLKLSLMGTIKRIDLPLTYYYAHSSNLSHANKLFVEGLYVLDQMVTRDQAMPRDMKRAVKAQALRTDAVARMAAPEWSEQWTALMLLMRSLEAYFIPSTLTRLGFLVLTIWMPPRLRMSVFASLKRLKFKAPSLRDLIGQSKA